MISADIIVAEDSTFALPEINVGVIADAATIKLRRRIPYHVVGAFWKMDGYEGENQTLGSN